MSNDPSVLLKTIGLERDYPNAGVKALAGVDLEINAGDYVAITGPSGSGKSTLLNMLGALDRPTEGEVFFEGEPLGKMVSLDDYRSQNIGFVFQSFHLLPVLTAIENVQVPMFESTLTVSQRSSKAADLLELVNIAHRAKHLPNEMSVGERQRVAIARALANEPAMILADEPTGNLDSNTAAEIIGLFGRLHEESQATIVMVTHDLDLARQTDRVIRMRDGQVIEDSGTG